MGETSDKTLKWIEAATGPLLLLPETLLPAWRGVEGSSRPRSDGSDFDRACGRAMENDVSLLEVGTGEGLLLGDESYATTWWRLPASGGGMLLRWLWGDDEEEVIDFLRGKPDLVWMNEPVTFDARKGRVILFDSALSGEEIIDGITFQIAPGRHAVASANVQSSEDNCLLVYRLLPLQ